MSKIYNQIFRHSKTPSVVFEVDDPQFTIVDVNDAYLDIALAPKEHILGKSVFEAFPDLESDNNNGASDLLHALQQTVATREEFKMPIVKYDLLNHFTGKREEKYWEWVSYPLFDEEDSVSQVLVKINDITFHIKGLMGNRSGSVMMEEVDFKFKNIFDLSSVGIALIDLQGNWLEVNPKMTEFFGYGRWELLKKNFQSMTHPGDLDDCLEGIDKLLRNEVETFKTEKRYYHRNGKTVWVYVSLTLIRDTENNPLHIVAHLLDITDKKEIELALQDSEQRYQSLFHHNPDPVYAFDLDGKFVSANEATCKLLEVKMEELIGTLFLPLIPFEEKRRVYENFLQASEGKSLSYNTNILTAKGKSRTFIITNLPITSNGEIVGVYGIAKDITEKVLADQVVKKAKDQYEQLISTIDGMVWEADENLKTNFISPQTAKILGFKPDDWYEKDNFWFDHVHPEDKKHLWTNFLQGMESGDNFTFESRMIAADGRTVWLRNNVAVIKRPGRITILRGVMTDISTAKIAEKKLAAKEAKLSKIMDRSLDVICTIDKDGKFIDVSSASEKMLGYLPDELRGQPFINYVYPEDVSITEQAEKEIVSGKDITDFDNRYVHKNGSIVYISWSVHFDAQDQMMFCVAKDITERKAVESALRMSTHRYELVTQATSDAVWDWDLDTDKVHRGQGYQKMFGYGPLDLPDNAESWKNNIHPRDLARVQESIENFILSTNLTWEEEYRYRKSDGNYAHVLDKAIAVRNESNQAIRLVGALQDISREKLLEKEDKLKIELGAIFRNENSPYTALKESLSTILMFTELPYGEIWFKTPNQEHLTLSAFGGNIFESPDKFKTVFESGEGIPGLVWKENKKMFFHDLQQAPLFSRKEFAKVNKLESAVVFPLVSNGKTIAVFSLYTQDKETVIEKTNQISTGISEQLATDFVLKKAENELNLFFDLSGDMLFMAGMEGSFRKVNKAVEQMLGYTQHEICSEPFLNHIHPDDLPATEEVFRDLLEGKPLLNFENRLLSKNGDSIWVSWSSIPVVEEGVIISVARDITLRKQYEEDLKTSKEQVTKTLESIQDAFYAVDTNWKVTYWNKQAEKLLLRTKDEMMGANLWTEFPEAKDLEFYRQYKKVMETQTPSNFIEYFPPLEKWYEVSAYPAEIGVTVYFKDVTQKINQEQEVLEARKKVDDILESIQDAFFAVDKEWNVTYWNQEAERYLGVTREVVLGKNLWESFPEAVSLAFYEKYNQVMQERVTLTFEEYFPPVELWFEVTAYPGEDGITVYFKDINERKKMELELYQFQKVIENTKEGIGIINLQQNTHYRNPAFIQNLGLSTDYPGVEGPNQIYSDPLKAKEVFDTLMRGEYFNGEVSLVKKSGEIAAFHLSAGPIFDEDNKEVIAVFGIHSDLKKEQNDESLSAG
jgi:PAS domain S-box-containing protein